MDGIAWAASAMVAARTRLEIATQNLANASTDGFTPAGAHGLLDARGVTIARTARAREGALRYTGRDLDFAIIGDGAFRVRDADGQVRETRAGAFTRGVDGTLRDLRGRVVLGLHGALRVPEGARLNAQELSLPVGSRLTSGYLEGSAVDAISEMVDVLAAERSFESAEKAVAAIDLARQKSAEAARVK